MMVYKPGKAVPVILVPMNEEKHDRETCRIMN